MVKRDKNLKNKNTKTAVTPAPEDISQESLNEDSEDLQEDQEVTKKEYKKSRMKNLEKNIEILEANDTKTGVIYIGHLPWGFDEVGLKKYFEQFGKITRILVPRSSKVNFNNIDWKNERVCLYRI
jgi:RNA recognition motif-containing protein